MIKSYSFCLLIVVVSVLLETAVLSNISLLPAVPDLVLICSLYFAINNGSLQGESMGFVSGLLIDFLSGSAFGFNSLIRTVIGYISGFFKRMLNINSSFVAFLIGLCGTIFKAILVYVTSFFFPNMVNTYNIFTSVFLFELIFNSILTPIIFKFLNCFSNFITIHDYN